jgi:hypothetical protein
MPERSCCVSRASSTRAALVLAIVALGSSSQTVSEVRGRVDSIVAAAKERAETTVTIDQLHSRDYPLVTSADDGLRITSPLVVRVIALAGGLSADRNHVVTWYQAQILENPTGAKLPAATSAPDADIAPPPLFKHIADDSVVICNSGGTFESSGVVVEAPETPVPLRAGSKYLLFLRFLENRDGIMTRIATLGIGDGGVFAYNDATDELSAAGERDNRRFASSVLRLCGGYMSGMRSLLASAAHRSTQNPR